MMLMIGGDWVVGVSEGGTFFNFSCSPQLNYFSPPRPEKANHLAEDFHRFSELEQDGIERVAIVSFNVAKIRSCGWILRSEIGLCCSCVLLILSYYRSQLSLM